ncbi:class I SAM-dependent methyltransferase [Flavobacterium ardleyense]|uniref:Class I SAM-dependent methyltransferase n=1 Tax=Flavobacterium ardleyense TaxID=2038737 RepID=A0ABW5Z6P7_9FLAO
MDEIINYYDKIASIYEKDRFDNTYGTFIDKQERKVLNRLLYNKQEVIVDMACGSGRFLNFANFGVDGSSEMVKISKLKFPDKTIFLCDAENTDFEDNTVDTIISFHFFMHLSDVKVKNILMEWDRILTNNGRIIFDIPSSKRRKLLNFKKNNWHGSFSLTNREIKQLNLNFEIRQSFGILFIPIHRIPKGIRKLFLKLDALLSNSFLKEYSSYQIIELVKK